MYTIMIPLGLIVDTDVERSIKAFGQLFTALKLGIDLGALLPELQPKFEKFYLGGYANEQEFADDLLATIKAKIPADNTELNPAWEEVWQAEWREYWNEQCRITPNTIAVLELIAQNPDLSFVIFSETNPTHYAFINAELIRQGVDVTKLNICTSFAARQPIEKLMALFLAGNEDAAKHQCTRITGNVNNITNPMFKHLARAKEQRILEALAPYDLITVTIPETQLITVKLQMIIDDIRRTLQAGSQASALHNSSLSSPTYTA